MDVTTLGNTGLRIGRIGLGTVKIGRVTGLKYPAVQIPGCLPGDAQVVELLCTARDAGVNLIDTAPAYGAAEERLGSLLPRVAPRSRWVLCTKVGESWDGAQSTYDFSAVAIRASIERSLKQLRVEHLDIVLLHGSSLVDDAVILADEPLGALRDAQHAGLVRAVGASVSTADGGVRACARCDVIMVTLNALEQAHAPAVDAARERGVGVLVKKALASGHADPAQSLRTALGYPGVHAAVVGTGSALHLKQLAGVL